MGFNSASSVRVSPGSSGSRPPASWRKRHLTAVHPELLTLMRASYGLAGIIYEVTLQVKPIEALHFTYTPRSVDQLTQADVDQYLKAEGLICWTVGRTCVFQRRQEVSDTNILSALEASAREHLWNFGAAYAGHIIETFLADKNLRDAVQNGAFDFTKFLFSTLHRDRRDYDPRAPAENNRLPANARRGRVCFRVLGLSVQSMAGYDARLSGFRGSAFRDNRISAATCRSAPITSGRMIRVDSVAPYDEEVFSVGPIHAVTDEAAWATFLVAFNDFAAAAVESLAQIRTNPGNAHTWKRRMDSVGSIWSNGCEPWTRDSAWSARISPDPHGKTALTGTAPVS